MNASETRTKLATRSNGAVQDSQRRFIPVAEPVFIGNEKRYVNECLDSTWISSNGKFIDQFEQAFAGFCNVEHALSCSNGTVALHLALLGLGVGAGDEVIVPTLTYVATANAVTYCGATPVFVDSESDTWNLDPTKIEERITARTRGIIVVHLFGHPVDMDPIMEIARRHSLFVIEDAAEAHGAEYKGRRIGSIGDVATFSFYGNKIITTGEGGMVTTNDATLARKMRQLKGQGQSFEQRYWFPIVGYNYRMTNIEAALGLAQLESVDWHLARRREIAGWYHELLSDHPLLTLQPERADVRHVYWINSVVMDENHPLSRDETMRRLAEEGIETRPFFYPMHVMPVYRHLAQEGGYPIAETVASRGLNLPSSAKLTRDEIAYIAERLNEFSK